MQLDFGGATTAQDLFEQLSADFYIQTNGKVKSAYNGSMASADGVEGIKDSSLDLAVSDAPLTDAEKFNIGTFPHLYSYPM